MRRMRLELGLIFCGLSLIAAPGCGSSSTPEEPPTAAIVEHAANARELPTAAVGHASAEVPADAQPESPAQGSPEQLLEQIAALRAQTLPDGMPLAERQAKLREQNLEVVELAMEAISLSHADPEQSETFVQAVNLLMDARLKLAWEGNKPDIDALYQDAAMLYQRDPKSQAAADASYALARFAHTNAQQYAREEPRWLQEFARQAKLYAANFPHDEGRAVSLLFSAAWSCELHALADDAVQCYTLLQTKFPNSPQSQQVPAILRRLTLAGKPVQLACETLDGKYLTIEQFKGKVVLVAFWATDARRFHAQLPQLVELGKKYPADKFQILGVNLDEDQAVVEQFVQQNALTWPQLFPLDAQKRRWNSTITAYYGIRDIPMLWLVDQYGNAVDTMADPDKLDAQIATLLQGR